MLVIPFGATRFVGYRFRVYTLFPLSDVLTVMAFGCSGLFLFIFTRKDSMFDETYGVTSECLEGLTIVPDSDALFQTSRPFFASVEGMSCPLSCEWPRALPIKKSVDLPPIVCKRAIRNHRVVKQYVAVPLVYK